MNGNILIWIVLLISSFISASNKISTKWILNNKVDPIVLYILSIGFYLIGDIIIIILNYKKLNKFKTDLKKLDFKHLIPIILFPIITVIVSFFYLKILENNNITLLSPTRSIIIIVLTIVFGFFFLSEKIDEIMIISIMFMVIGVSLLIYKGFCDSKNN